MPTLISLSQCLKQTGPWLWAGCLVVLPARAEDGRQFFENRIRPVLVEHCYECHSAQSDKPGGGLLLDHPEALRKGGVSGKPIQDRDASASLLIQALHYRDVEMPPDKPLPPSVIADFETWVKMGAPDPRQTGVTQEKDSETPKALWSLQPLVQPSIPEVVDATWPRDPMDFFVQAGWEKEGLRPAGDSTPEQLVRRLHVDLTGLVPTHEDVQAFRRAYEDQPDRAVAECVDTLLASPAFGERWGRHWLDVARYGESNGNDGLSRNPTFPHAWRYRDYVIDSFNRDVPYDRFLTEQIAGDLLPAGTDAERDRLLVATGYLALGAKPAKAMNDNFAMDVVADQIDTVTTGILGLSVACARCHDHKFDPVPTRDYYALAGIFSSTETLWGLAANEKLTAPATPLHVLKTAPRVLPEKEAQKINQQAVASSNDQKPTNAKLAYTPGTPLAMGVRDLAKPAHAKININGEAKKLGEVVPRGFLTAIPLKQVESIPAQSSGRLELARWLTHPDQPLTPRVAVNRIWLQLFGRGLVRTPDDFGFYGDRPTHPELLDHLALRFVREGWSVKQMIRNLVLSRTYRLSSIAPLEAMARDPENRFWARHDRRRMDAETLRDSVLLTSGELEPAWGDGSIIRHLDVQVNKMGSLHQPSHLRSVYLCLLRNSPPPELAALDFPDALRVQGQRAETVLPAHALYLLNNSLMVDAAQALADRTLRHHASTGEEGIRHLHRRVLAREPSQREVDEAARLLESVQATEQAAGRPLDKAQHAAWAALAQALMMTSEFRYVD